MKTVFELSPSYFAAANSFEGFKSNFDKIFAPKDYVHIYVLKGGPGTGKSTLMKRVAEEQLKNGADITKFYCSSDPKSLDGIIIAHNAKKIAIIDGTSPHAVETRYPGAAESIINLGAGLNKSELSKRRDEITDCSNRKNASYEAAYGYLKICGELHRCIFDKIKTTTIYSEAEYICDQIMQYELFREKYEEPCHNYWLGSFSKNGYVRLDIPCIEKEYISIKGDGFTEHIVMNMLLEHLATERAVSLVAKSAYTHKCIDALITCSCIISTDTVGALTIDTTLLSRLFDSDYKKLRQSYDAVLELARRSLNEASNYHFLLEEIYKQNIDFSYNDSVIGALKSEIPTLLY